MSTLYLDTETFSDVPLKRGHHAYFEGKQAQIMVATWALDDGEVVCEDLTDIEPDGSVTVRGPSDALVEAITFADEIVIHNSPFDRTGIRKLWGIDISARLVFDTMACAMAHSLPGSLGKLCAIMGVPTDEAKDENGKALINLFCKPRPKNVKVRRATKATHPVEWAQFLKYATADIPPMRHLREKLPKWNFRNTNQHQERALWELDQRINERGFLVDVYLAKRALATIDREQRKLARKTKLLTGGQVNEDGEIVGQDVDKATQRNDLLVHIFVEYGLYLPDLKKDTLERQLLDPEVPDALKQLIRVRLATTTTSTAKYKALLNSVSRDGALRGTTQFCGAIRTGRWGGRLFQPHNLPRPDMKPDEILRMIEALQADCLDVITGEVMRALSNMLRGLIIARPGRKLVAADLEQIESRVAAWLSGEQWKLDAVALYDTGKGFDNYVMAYAKAFGVTPQAVMDDKKANGFWRQVGKVMELAFGYEGGVAAWLAFAMVYRLDLDALADSAYPTLPHVAREQAEIMFEWRAKKGLGHFGLSRKTFVVIEAFKALWRQGHQATASYWPELGKAAIEAVQHPKREVEARKLVFEKRGAWLYMILPSGRRLCYPSPKVKEKGRGEALSYSGVQSFGARNWATVDTYGGKLFENATQAVARDVMAYNMPRIEDAGYPILLTVHDEVITEPKDNADFTTAKLSSILATNPPWLAGCPLAAGGFEDYRYRKD